MYLIPFQSKPTGTHSTTRLPPSASADYHRYRRAPPLNPAVTILPLLTR